MIASDLMIFASDPASSGGWGGDFAASGGLRRHAQFAPGARPAPPDRWSALNVSA